MESENIKIAKKVIQQYPEVFESLLEFERTRKVPKLYRRQRFNITIDENILSKFKTLCEKENLNMSRVLEQSMLDKIKSNSS